MFGGRPAGGMEDLLGAPLQPGNDIYSVPTAEPGKTVDLSGASGISAHRPPGGNAAHASSSGGYGAGPPPSYGGSSYGGGFGNGPAPLGPGSRSPSSIEGGGGAGLSLSGLSPANIVRQLGSRPITELVVEQSRNLASLPRVASRVYQSAARRYLRPWSEFARVSPGRILQGFRNASRRGEIQIYVQRNVLANAKAFCPNYLFIFLAMMFMFVCTSPMLLLMLGGVGGGWTHAMRSEGFRNRPWQLQLGGVSVPLGSNAKMAILSLPTLFILHFFMGPVLWSAALCSGGVNLAHAALRDRSDDRDEDQDQDDHGLGPSSVRIRELP